MILILVRVSILSIVATLLQKLLSLGFWFLNIKEANAILPSSLLNAAMILKKPWGTLLFLLEFGNWHISWLVIL